MVIREGSRLWPYRDQYQLTELLAAADAVVVLSLMVGTVLCAIAAFSPAGLGRRRLPFWRQGQIERAKSGNFGTADWMPISEARKRSEEHTSELQSIMRISYAVFCLKKKK